MDDNIFFNLGCYFVKHEDCNDIEKLKMFFIFSEIMYIQKNHSSLLDEYFYIKNNKLEIPYLNLIIEEHKDLRNVFIEEDCIYNHFSINIINMVNSSLTLINNEEKFVLNTIDKIILSLNIEEGIIFQKEFYIHSLRSNNVPEELIDYSVNEILYHQYVKKILS